MNSCSKCCFYQEHTSRENDHYLPDGSILGLCRRFPPKAMYVTKLGGAVRNAFTEVSPNSWCGEFLECRKDQRK